ncbi:hypothetical protein CTI12_AA595100 [Artemisia annua]|uniref:Ulp1 protease family, C-terminal catalytic domain-containing protein n=1 Tax=Artemisia annua TaxID=35608 RepID=A0A2U1KJN3_ARTAN|nr:hypothetical protein CTI12_AA595100 [Artemisia annua]
MCICESVCLIVWTGFHGGNRRTRTKSVPFKKRPVGSLETDLFLPSFGGDQKKVVEGSVVKKGNRMRSKFFIVSKEQVGKKTAGKQKLVDEDKDDEEDVYNEVGVRKRIRKSKLVGEAVAKNKDEKGVGFKVPDVDRIHQRISLWSLHRLLPNLSPKQREDVNEMGFGAVLGFSIKDVPTRLTYWLLDNFDEDRCILNVDGKEISITRETVRDVLGIPMGNVVYAESLRQRSGNGEVQMPLVNNWTVDVFNKLEEDRFTTKTVEYKMKLVS